MALFARLKHITIFLIAVSMLVFPFSVFADETDDLGLCPQSRTKTPKAPEEYLQKVNPLEKTSKNLKKGKLLYRVSFWPKPCSASTAMA